MPPVIVSLPCQHIEALRRREPASNFQFKVLDIRHGTSPLDYLVDAVGFRTCMKKYINHPLIKTEIFRTRNHRIHKIPHVIHGVVVLLDDLILFCLTIPGIDLKLGDTVLTAIVDEDISLLELCGNVLNAV